MENENLFNETLKLPIKQENISREEGKDQYDR